MALLCAIAPPIAAELAYALWRHLGAPVAVHERESDVHARARRGLLTVGRERVVTYAWGDGPQVVLLVHGWRSRASRFAALIHALESPERTIVAFDAPGNGDSSGRRVTILDYVRAIGEMHRTFGSFEAIIGHSFGVLSTFVAVRQGVRAERIVGLAGMYDANHLMEQFSRQLALSAAVQDGVRWRFERRALAGVVDPWQRFVAKVDPNGPAIPVLLVHDDRDSVVDPSQASLIAEAHRGPVRVLMTHGLGHSKVLHDPEVVATVGRFLDGSADAVGAEASRSRDATAA